MQLPQSLLSSRKDDAVLATTSLAALAELQRLVVERLLTRFRVPADELNFHAAGTGDIFECLEISQLR